MLAKMLLASNLERVPDYRDGNSNVEKFDPHTYRKTQRILLDSML